MAASRDTSRSESRSVSVDTEDDSSRTEDEQTTDAGTSTSTDPMTVVLNLATPKKSVLARKRKIAQNPSHHRSGASGRKPPKTMANPKTV